MEDKSFLSKFIIILIILVLIILTVFLLINKDEVSADMKELETITSLNVDTYDYDMYVYKLENDTLYTSEFFYNKYYLDNNVVEYDKYIINSDTKIYLKTLSNSATDINDIKISYDPITKDEFNFLLNNYTLLKTYIWLKDNNTVRNILLYSSNNIDLEME